MTTSRTPHARSPARRRRPASLTFTAGMASYLDSGALAASGFAIGGFYVGPLGLDTLTIGVLLGLQTLAFAIGAVAGGLLSDRLGRRRVLLAALFLYAAGVATLAAAQGQATLAVGAILTGLAIGADLPSSLALLSEGTPTRKARSLANSQLLWVTGLGATAAIAFALSSLGETAGRLLFVHLLLVSLIVLGLRMNMPESREWSTARHRADGHAHHAVLDRGTTTVTHATPHDQGASDPVDASGPARPAAATGGSLSPTPTENTSRSFHIPAAVVAVTAYYTLWNLGANTLGQFRPYLWTQVLGGTSRGAAALILMAVPFAVIGGLMFARLADSPLRGRWVLTASILTTTGWLSVAIWPSQPTFIALVFCFAAAAAVSGEAMYKIWIHDFVPTLSRATVQGTSLAAARVVTAGFALLTPSLARLEPRLVFGVICAAQAAATLIAVQLIARRTLLAPRRAQAPAQTGK